MPNHTHPDAAALAAEVTRLVEELVEHEVESELEAVTSCKRPDIQQSVILRVRLTDTIHRLAALAQRPESTSERTYCRFCGGTNPVGCKLCRPVIFSAQGEEVDLRGIDAGTLDDWNNLRSHGKVLANDQLVLVADLPTIIARTHHAGQVEEAVRRDAETEFELHVHRGDDVMVEASASSGTRENALREIARYFAQYSEDADRCEVFEVFRRQVDLDAELMAALAARAQLGGGR